MAKEGTKEQPWKLKTPPLTSDYEMYLDQKDGKDVIVCVVGKTTLLYDHRCLADLQAMLKKHVIGWSWAVPMSRSLPRKVPLKHGAALKKIRWVAGTD